jgi:hypothetical protein
MKLTADQMAALIQANPTHAQLITTRAIANDDEASIRSAIAAADGKSKDEQITALTAAAKAKDDQLAKLTTDLAAMTKKHDDLAALGGGAPRDPGAGASADVNASGGTDESAFTTEWNASAQIRDTFALGGLKSYICHRKHEEAEKAKNRA